MHHVVRTLSVLLALFLPFLTPPAQAQFDQDPVSVSAYTRFTHVARGEDLAVAVIIDHAEHFHTWPNKPVVPPELAGLFPYATEIEFSPLPTGVSLAGVLQWPEPKPVPMLGPKGMVDVLSYAGTAIVYFTLRIDDDAPLGETSVSFLVAYQACDDTRCLIPDESHQTITFTITEAPPDDRTPLHAAYFAEYRGPIAPSDPPPATTDEPSAPVTQSAQRLFLGFIPIPERSGLIVIALLSIVGGFVLNLTPCVLPVIPIKIMTLTQHAGTRGRTLFLGVMMALGVMAFWVGIGLPVMIVQEYTDPSRIFAIWWVTLGLGLLIALLAAGIMGLFTFNLPQGLYRLNPKADSAHGSFLFGVMTAILGLPCFGFVAGALLGAVSSQPTHVTFVVFTAIGIGMALPYLVLSFNPKLIEKIPRTGPASELVKQVLGLLMLAAGAYFTGAGLMALVAEQPHLAKVLHWWFVAAFTLSAGLWLAYRTFKITRRPGRRATFLILGLATGVFAVGWADSRTRAAARDRELWHEYTPEAFGAAQSSGKIVVLDFTADWCINCKALKATVLDRPEVSSRLADRSVVPMTADLTSRTAPGWRKLEDLGERGIPLLVIYGADGSEIFRSNAYTAAQVLQALDRAR
ncbi:MAG: thioredoxin family protein [Phycisphaeraceae bacterium]|nr:thioredoxin family protein [Phycisphaeraceae bacterium]MCW5753255.1 thioredoxin family protein [Phycisphaeraceae bacterium]